MLASIYIRKEDEDKWRNLDNKTERIHQLLNSQPVGSPEAKTMKVTGYSQDHDKMKRFQALKESLANGIQEAPLEPAKDTPKCCSLNTPCKHWSFNNGAWTNSITGEVKEVV